MRKGMGWEGAETKEGNDKRVIREAGRKYREARKVDERLERG